MLYFIALNILVVFLNRYRNLFPNFAFNALVFIFLRLVS